MVDWTKPLMHQNGDPVELIESLTEDTQPGGYLGSTGGRGKLLTRCIYRPNSSGMTGVWWVPEDGIVWPDSMSIVNRPENDV
jgi:hypothetical protein